MHLAPTWEEQQRGAASDDTQSTHEEKWTCSPPLAYNTHDRFGGMEGSTTRAVASFFFFFFKWAAATSKGAANKLVLFQHYRVEGPYETKTRAESPECLNSAPNNEARCHTEKRSWDHTQAWTFGRTPSQPRHTIEIWIHHVPLVDQGISKIVGFSFNPSYFSLDVFGLFILLFYLILWIDPCLR